MNNSLCRTTGIDDPSAVQPLPEIDSLFVILGQSHQVLTISDDMIRRFGVAECSKYFGLRLGEPFEGEYPNPGNGSYGHDAERTNNKCRGAIAQALRESDFCQTERAITLHMVANTNNENIVLGVKAHPILIGGQKVLLLSFRDRTQELQTLSAERNLLHDLNNHLSSISIIFEMFTANLTGRERNLAANGLMVARHMASEIAVHQAQSHGGSTALFDLPIVVIDLLDEVKTMASTHPAAADRLITISLDKCADGNLRVNGRVLLGRILINMVVNACEATAPGGIVRLSATRRDDRVELSVWNREQMPPDAQRRVFRRHFSSKGGPSRGIGTWSMKELGERLLGGKVSFTSTKLDGTTFLINIPLSTTGTSPSKKHGEA